MSVPRGTLPRAERVGTRVSPDTKVAVRGLIVGLTARGVPVTEADLVGMLLTETLTARRGKPDLPDLDRRLRAWRSLPRAPRGGHDQRVATRVRAGTKTAVQEVAAGLSRRGLRATEADLVSMLLNETLTALEGKPDLPDLDRRLREWRALRS